jgi:ribosome-associated toxin RatA of RatAB toxin-antitoxin module
MQRVNKSALVPYSAVRMFELVDQIDLYPQFLPWCSGTRLLATHPAGKTARIDIDYYGVRTHFTTENVNRAGKSIVVTLLDGPFRELNGEWRFKSLAAEAAKVEFDLTYTFANNVFEAAVGPVFRHIADTFVDAFVRRAESVYPRTP